MTAPDGDALFDNDLVVDDALERRSYQLDLAASAARDHTLVSLPTGLGKTTVSLLVGAHRLATRGGTLLMLAPTKPLVEQHAAFYRETLQIADDAIVVFTGEVRPADRAALWDEARIVMATPQVVENDLLGSRIDLNSVTHLTVDECHRASGDYPYGFVAERYHATADDPLVTGMSASPGEDRESILAVCEALGLRSVAVKTREDGDVAEYTHDTDIQWERIELPDAVIEIRDGLADVIADRLATLKELGVTNKTDPNLAQREINAIQGRVQELMDADKSEGYEAMSYLAEIRKLRTALTYVETQSVESLRRYFERLQEGARSSGASKADQRVVSDPRVRESIDRARRYDDLHPKFRRVRMLIAEALGIENGERVIVFTESRDTAEELVAFLGEHFATRKFVGQSDTETSAGMTQTEQQDALDAFRAGEFEVLVSTSVAEEGLDVPEVDLVCFYEPVPTAIRAVQRKGRTGRQAAGRVHVLIAEDTRDEAYFWKARRDQQRMHDELETLKTLEGDIEGELRGGGSAVDPDASTPDVSPPDTAATSADGGQTDLGAFEGGDGREGDGDTDGSDDRTDEAATARDAGESTDDAKEADAEGADGDGRSDPVPDPSDLPDGETVAGDRPDPPEPSADTVEIVIDQRELDSAIGRDLARREGVETRLETLDVGDYVCSDRVVVERKTVPDFLDSLVGGDRSIFEQIASDARYYDRPVLILEGDGLFEERSVHPNAIRGALASLAADFGVSVLRTADSEGTAAMLAAIANREQSRADRAISVHGEKQSRTLPEQQEYTVASIAEVGPVTARSLLDELGSVAAVVTADEEELREVSGVGAVTAERIREVVATEYDP
ncbi:DEAD/DEAH box helicase [Halococcoides cellulosivorans]|uniref:Hef nuclease n=1 Tax=Halococcoides cellulosivorans TaxID=1679096 RepID=A0A2R4X4I9_9EURY|nr:DEAD/DEAH box helicase [Halococcoides cellulosivorans]AWB28711.1 Hef nuclease [Halococcoides cellulosivorans]